MVNIIHRYQRKEKKEEEEYHVIEILFLRTHLHCIWSLVISSSSILNSDLSAGAVAGLLTTTA